MANAPTLEERTQADTRFHMAILRASGNELLVPLGVLIESALSHLFVHTTREEPAIWSRRSACMPPSSAWCA